MVEDRIGSGAGHLDVRLRDPEQLASELGLDDNGNHHVSARAIRNLARGGLISFVRGPRGKVLFDEVAIKALLNYMRQPAREFELEPEPEPDWETMASPFNFATKAGQRRRRTP